MDDLIFAETAKSSVFVQDGDSLSGRAVTSDWGRWGGQARLGRLGSAQGEAPPPGAVPHPGDVPPRSEQTPAGPLGSGPSPWGRVVPSKEMSIIEQRFSSLG